jgi:hypothetical protein
MSFLRHRLLALLLPLAAGEYLPALERHLLVSPDSITARPGTKHLAISIKLLGGRTEFSRVFQNNVARMLQGVLRHSSGALEVVVLTSEDSLEAAHRLVRGVRAAWVGEGVLRGRRGQGPSLTLRWVDLDQTAQRPDIQQFIEAQRRWEIAGLAERSGGFKLYQDTLFYLHPLYHKIFPNLDRLVTFDTDTELQSDLGLLYDQFNQFEPSSLLGIGLELTPYYHLALAEYREVHPDTELGQPGRGQGFNQGVLLLDLERMRASAAYAELLQPAAVDRVMGAYGFYSTLGVQDWLTNLGFARPDLFYILPCQWNAQHGVEHWRPPYEETFPQYHTCPGPLHLVHRNGCGPRQEHCLPLLRAAGLPLPSCLTNL